MYLLKRSIAPKCSRMPWNGDERVRSERDKTPLVHFLAISIALQKIGRRVRKTPHLHLLAAAPQHAATATATGCSRRVEETSGRTAMTRSVSPAPRSVRSLPDSVFPPYIAVLSHSSIVQYIVAYTVRIAANSLNRRRLRSVIGPPPWPSFLPLGRSSAHANGRNSWRRESTDADERQKPARWQATDY